MQEANLEATDAGVIPASDGWYVVNVRDTLGTTRARGAVFADFEGPEPRYPHFGINVAILEDGVPNCLYHRESNQEAMLVLEGEPLLIIEGEERRLKQWDFVYCPPEATHVFVGPGVILMVGARDPDETVHYPVDETAKKYGASAVEATDDPKEAYPAAGFGAWRAVPTPWPR